MDQDTTSSMENGSRQMEHSSADVEIALPCSGSNAQISSSITGSASYECEDSEVIVLTVGVETSERIFNKANGSFERSMPSETSVMWTSLWVFDCKELDEAISRFSGNGVSSWESVLECPDKKINVFLQA